MAEFTRNTPLPDQGDFNSWSKRFKERQERFDQKDNFVSFTFMGPALLNLMSDLHIGHPSTDYGRIESEAEAIVTTANSFLILVGDEIDNMSWNPGQFGEMEQTPEQLSYLRSLLQYFADNGKLLHRIAGDHDGWLMRAGFNIGAELPSRYGASNSHGPTFFEMNVDNQAYRMSGTHQLPGHSMYNHTHPQMRYERFAAGRGADVIFSGHNHQKGYAEDYAREWPGEPHRVHYIALGPYKQTDEWLSKKGYPRQKAKEMFGASVYLKPGQKEVIYFEDIIEANQKMRSGRR